MKNLLGLKKGMTQVFIENKAVPVTVVEVPELRVCRKFDVDGKTFVEVGFGEKKHPTKAEVGVYGKADKVPSRSWVVVNSDEDLKAGDSLDKELLSVGDIVSITGVTKAKGFAGVIKRWGFGGGPKTHGQSDRMRAPGSIGAGTDPGRVLKGKKMAGRMGGKNKTLLGRRIVDVGENYVLVKGSLPGNNGSLLKIELTKVKDEG